MSDVNPNVDVGEETSVEAGFGEDGLTSFDDMEAVMSEETAPQAEAAEPAEKVEAEAKKDVSSDTQEDEVSAEDDKEEAEATEEEIKLIKAMKGENEHELPEDVVFLQKVNGVEEEVTLRELLNDYSGRTDYNRKYNEFGKEKQELKEQRFQLDNRVNTFIEKSKESTLDGLAYLAESAGADPVEFIKGLKQGLVPDLEQYMNMSQAEKDAYDSKQELEILKKSNDTRSSQEQQMKEFQELEQQTLKQVEDLGIERQEYAAAYDRLVGSGTIPSDQIGPEAVAQWIGLENRVSVVDSVLSEIDPNLAEDVALIEDLVRTSLEGGLDEQATREVINEVYGQPSKEAKSASKKVRQDSANLKSVTNKIVKKESEDDHYGSDDSEPLSFDDI